LGYSFKWVAVGFKNIQLDLENAHHSRKIELIERFGLFEKKKYSNFNQIQTFLNFFFLAFQVAIFNLCFETSGGAGLHRVLHRHWEIWRL